MTHYLRLDAVFVCTDKADSDEAFDDFTDRVFDELLKLQAIDTGIVEPDVTANLAERKMSILLGIEASTSRDAIRLFLANVRCALHAAECGTEGWPRYEPADDPLPPVRHVDFAGA
ncbi:hypothetical protein [Spongiactinospora sp. 9N601]|uniref:hypothetical protein n=1 Tax=Spongiactinospora sp. 9N601 TaxID=3375149 RepID=UPI0037A6998D